VTLKKQNFAPISTSGQMRKARYIGIKSALLPTADLFGTFRPGSLYSITLSARCERPRDRAAN
jgi:hypothetical protein